MVTDCIHFLQVRWRFAIATALLLLGAGFSIASAQLAPSNLAVGEAANEESDGTECASGLAVDATIGMFCSDTCTSDADCTLDGWGCRQVYEPGTGERTGICFPRRVIANP